MKIPFRYLCLVACLLSHFALHAQTDTATRQKVAVFVPLYLDSAFDAADTYRFGKQFPKFLNPGLEFFEGVQIALDSLEKEGVKLEVQVFDTRSAKLPVS